MNQRQSMYSQLWFDVENERYTTEKSKRLIADSCGLMQKMKDIQQKLYNKT